MRKRKYCREAVPIGAILNEFLKKRGLEKRYLCDRAINIWKSVVSAEIAAHARPIRVERGKMIVAVDDPVVRQEIHFEKLEILDKVNAELGKDVIKKIILC